MSFEFQSTLVNVTPTFRIGGNQIGGARKEVITGIPTLRLVIVDDADIRFALSGPFESGDPDAIYTALSADLYEIADGLLINEGAVSSVEIGADMITVDFNGEDHTYKFKPNADATGATEVASHTWEITTAGFAALSTAAATWRSSLDGTLEGLSSAIADEVAERTSDVARLDADLAAETAARIAAITAEEQRVDALIASGMWLFADQASFPPAADNHGRVVHSHADGAIFYAHGGMWHQVAKEVDLQSTIDSVANETSARVAADDALSGRLDVLEADPTTATAVAAGDAATLSSANSYTDTQAALKLDAADVSTYGLTLVDDADAATARNTLGLGTAATTDASAYATAAQGALADTAVQPAAISNVDNTSDADKPVSTATQAALDLKADLAGATFSGDVTIDEGAGSTIKLETSDATSAGIHIEGPTGSMGYIDTTNGFGNDSLQVYSANFWVRAINNGTGNVIIDGTLTLAGTALTATFTELNQLAGVTLGTAASTDSTAYATAAQGATADTAAQLDGTNFPGPFNNDSEAATGGVAVGGIYKNTNGTIHWRVS